MMEDHSVVPMPVEAPNMAEMYSVENHTTVVPPQMVPDPSQDYSNSELMQEDNSMGMAEDESDHPKRSWKDDDEDGTPLKRSASSSPSPDEPAAKKRSDETDKLWKNVHENPSDFQNWTLLLQHIDQLSELESGREAYDGFFERYPYCYGYWKKYADLERRKGTLETAMQVFNRGLDAIQLSVDLWIHYLEFVMTSYPEDEILVRSEFERAIDTAGLEFKSDKLWETYINWETAGKRWKNVTQLYERLTATPTSKYMQHWTKFQEHVKKYLPSEVVGVEEFLNLRRAILAEMNPNGETPDEAPPGVEATQEDDQVGANVAEGLACENGLSQSHQNSHPKLHDDSVLEDEEMKTIQKRIIDTHQEIHEKNMEEVKKRWTYEDAIKRPYFHVKPLEKSQLVAWRNYLDFEVKEGNEKQTRVLFERCLIACALYEEFWMRFVRYLEESSAPETDIRDVYKRACCIHLQAKYRPHLSWAAFEEERGDCEKSLEILGDVTSRVESCLEPWIQLAGVERRRGNIKEAQEVYQRCLEHCRQREDKNIFAQVSLKYARFLSIFVNDPEKALEVLKEAKTFDDSNTNVLLGIVDAAMSCRPGPRLSDAAEALKSGTEATHQPQTRHMFAHRYFHFMNENGQEPSSVSEGLRTLRDVQAELRQLDKSNEEDFTSTNKSADGSMPVAVGYQKRPSQDKANSSSPMNGTSSSGAAQSGYQQGYQQPQQQQQQAQPQQQQQQQGYNQAYQGYNQGYGQHQGYQGWGYPQQQSGYGYGPQSAWGNYGNYYGQR